ncbi:glycosyltransferase [Deinococcus frigens]|uniref:glycosyltransferase n=1 Tax=Deinococcus frigens TaxID=249403 RepID=UPI00138DE184|nr:glycosyltransferase family 2 protein [Deinococcus frigens]
MRALIRLHRQPLGLLDVRVPPEGLTEAHLSLQIWQAFSADINRHLEDDGLAGLVELPIEGILHHGEPHCRSERRAFLLQAPFVSVVVATRNRPEQLPRLLDSLLGLNYPNYEVIVVDNAPADESSFQVIRARQEGEPRLRYAREDTPGLSNARNCGVMQASGEIVAITDDDVQPDKDWLLELARGFGAGDRVGCVTGAILAMRLDTSAQVWIEQYGGFNKGFEVNLFDMHQHRPASRLYPYAAGIFGSGANIAFRKDVLQAVGGFDPALGAGTAGMGGEELALFVRLLSEGHQIAYRPAAFLYHAHHEQYEALRRQMYSYGAGLTAYLTKTIFDRPYHLWRILLKLPVGMLYALSPKSKKNVRKSGAYPAELTRLEFRGMMYGPVAYARSCWQVRCVRWSGRNLKQIPESER